MLEAKTEMQSFRHKSRLCAGSEKGEILGACGLDADENAADESSMGALSCGAGCCMVLARGAVRD